jgi:hypothetical protein
MWLMNRSEKQLHKDNLTKKAGVEIVANRKATKDVVKSTQKINDSLYDLLANQNHITIKIFFAAGGKKGNK